MALASIVGQNKFHWEARVYKILALTGPFHGNNRENSFDIGRFIFGQTSHVSVSGVKISEMLHFFQNFRHLELQIPTFTEIFPVYL